jgi:hypothetical protein
VNIATAGLGAGWAGAPAVTCACAGLLIKIELAVAHACNLADPLTGDHANPDDAFATGPHGIGFERRPDLPDFLSLMVGSIGLTMPVAMSVSMSPRR